MAEDGSQKYMVGDKVTAYVANVAGSEIQLSTSLVSLSNLTKTLLWQKTTDYL